jgi:hypothetical protein
MRTASSCRALRAAAPAAGNPSAPSPPSPRPASSRCGDGGVGLREPGAGGVRGLRPRLRHHVPHPRRRHLGALKAGCARLQRRFFRNCAAQCRGAPRAGCARPRCGCQRSCAGFQARRRGGAVLAFDAARCRDADFDDGRRGRTACAGSNECGFDAGFDGRASAEVRDTSPSRPLPRHPDWAITDSFIIDADRAITDWAIMNWAITVRAIADARPLRGCRWTASLCSSPTAR